MTMQSSNLTHTDVGAGDLPLPVRYARLPAIERIFGINRARAYELLGIGAIRAIKDGRALLIEVASVEAYLASLPKATIRVGQGSFDGQVSRRAA